MEDDYNGDYIIRKDLYATASWDECRATIKDSYDGSVWGDTTASVYDRSVWGDTTASAYDTARTLKMLEEYKSFKDRYTVIETETEIEEDMSKFKKGTTVRKAKWYNHEKYSRSASESELPLGTLGVVIQGRDGVNVKVRWIIDGDYTDITVYTEEIELADRKDYNKLAIDGDIDDCKFFTGDTIKKVDMYLSDQWSWGAEVDEMMYPMGSVLEVKVVDDGDQTVKVTLTDEDGDKNDYWIGFCEIELITRKNPTSIILDSLGGIVEEEKREQHFDLGSPCGGLEDFLKDK